MTMLIKSTFLFFFLLVFQTIVVCQSSSTKAIKVVAPIYPDVMIITGISGKVVLTVDIDNNGAVKKVDFVDGEKSLAKISERAATMWEFNKTKNETLRTIRITFLYTLLSGNSLTDEINTVFLDPFTVEVKAKEIEIQP